MHGILNKMRHYHLLESVDLNQDLGNENVTHFISG